jgi:hypothetical protein
MTQQEFQIYFAEAFIITLLGLLPLWALYKTGEVTVTWADIKEFFSLNKPKPTPKKPSEHP